MFRIVKSEILKHLTLLNKEDKKDLVDKRINKFCSMGVVIEREDSNAPKESSSN